MSSSAGRARERGCYGMWVLTDVENKPARRTYRAAGGSERGGELMLEWRLGPR